MVDSYAVIPSLHPQLQGISIIIASVTAIVADRTRYSVRLSLEFSPEDFFSANTKLELPGGPCLCCPLLLALMPLQNIYTDYSNEYENGLLKFLTKCNCSK